GAATFDTLVRLARLLERRGMLAQAVAAYRRAVVSQENNGRLQFDFGRALLRNGQFVEAEASLRHAQELNAGAIVPVLPFAARRCWRAPAWARAQHPYRTTNGAAGASRRSTGCGPT